MSPIDPNRELPPTTEPGPPDQMSTLQLVGCEAVSNTLSPEMVQQTKPQGRPEEPQQGQSWYEVGADGRTHFVYFWNGAVTTPGSSGVRPD